MATEFHYLCPAPLSEEQVEELNWLTAATFRITGCLDVARVDFRLDRYDNHQPYILEINSLPGITPISDLTLMAEAAGWSHARLVYSVFEAALKRYGLQIDVPLHEYEEVRVR